MVVVATALLAGTILRLGWHTDIEWKSDEQWSFFHAQAMLATGAWPPLGMPSSMGPPNPGLSLWVFAGLMALTGARTAPELALAVQALNVIALAAFAAFAFVAIPKERREPWLWAAAIWAVNPISIILERKIWPPSVLPLAMVALIWAWWFRRHTLAAFVWGALGALMAQVHLGVVFLALALAAWTLWLDRAKFPWLGWIAGSVAGALPAVPWGLKLTSATAHAAGRYPSPRFYARWASDMFGFDARYALGGRAIGDFLAGPRIGGFPTHLMAATEVALIALMLVVLVRALVAGAAAGWPKPRTFFLGDSPETVLIAACVWGYGGALTLITFLGAGSYRHYMIVVTPLDALWTAMAIFWSDRARGRRWAPAVLSALCVLGALMSFGLLTYIHHEGVIPGEFGASWRAQQPGFVRPRDAIPLARRARHSSPASPAHAEAGVSASFSHARNSGVSSSRSA